MFFQHKKVRDTIQIKYLRVLVVTLVLVLHGISVLFEAQAQFRDEQTGSLLPGFVYQTSGDQRGVAQFLDYAHRIADWHHASSELAWSLGAGYSWMKTPWSSNDALWIHRKVSWRAGVNLFLIPPQFNVAIELQQNQVAIEKYQHRSILFRFEGQVWKKASTSLESQLVNVPSKISEAALFYQKERQQQTLLLDLEYSDWQEKNDQTEQAQGFVEKETVPHIRIGYSFGVNLHEIQNKMNALMAQTTMDPAVRLLKQYHYGVDMTYVQNSILCYQWGGGLFKYGGWEVSDWLSAFDGPFDSRRPLSVHPELSPISYQQWSFPQWWVHASSRWQWTENASWKLQVSVLRWREVDPVVSWFLNPSYLWSWKTPWSLQVGGNIVYPQWNVSATLLIRYAGSF